MRTAVVLHLFYRDLALDLIERVSRIDADFDVFVTGEALRDRRVAAALRRLSVPVEIVEADNAGRDVAPFLDTLPRLLDRGYELFCKLHTKRGNSGYRQLWRETFYEALIGSSGLVDRITEAFAQDAALGAVGPSEFYLSANRHMLKNAELAETAARVCFPGKTLPADWGFFAGTMFWARTEHFRSLLQLRRFGLDFDSSKSGDGSLEHAVERLLGMVGFMRKANVGLVSFALDGDEPALHIVAASDPVPRDTLAERLFAVGRNRIKRASRQRLREIIAEENPLLHYLRNGASGDLDPNPYFHNAWYAKHNQGPLEEGDTPLQHFIKTGGRRDRNPSLMFDVRYYRSTHPSRFESGVDALAHFLERGETLHERPLPPERTPAEGTSWISPKRFRRGIHHAQETAFLASLCEASPETENGIISVILALRGEAEGIEGSLDSVLSQTFKNVEVLVVDAGATRDAKYRVRRYLADSRIRLLKARGGLTSAWNQGLKASSGQIVAYIQPGCRWRANYLKTMSAFMRLEELHLAYCITEYCDGGRVYGYQGDQFDRDAFIDASYIDISAFCHARSFYEERGGFDEGTLSPAWDLIVRYSESARVGFAPFVGCAHRDWSVTIKSPAMRENAGEDKLGVLASSLDAAFRRDGRRSRIDYRGEWYSCATGPEELAIALRGPLAYDPPAGQFSILLNLCDDDRIEYEECDAHSAVYVAAESRRGLLDVIVKPPVLTLPMPEGTLCGAAKSGNLQGSGDLEEQARAISADVSELLHHQDESGARPGGTGAVFGRRWTRRRRVHLVLRGGADEPETSNFIRLLSPLTSESAVGQVELSIGGQDDIESAGACDVCVVSRAAIASPAKVRGLLKRLRASKARLVVETDDAYSLIDEHNPFHAEFMAQNACMEELMSHADQCWFSTRALMDLYGGLCASVAIIPNALDPRIWSTAPARSRPARSGLRLLYMGTRNHAGDLTMIMPALDAYERDAPGRLELTVIGVADTVPERPWLRHCVVPVHARSYPRFVRWLQRQGPFDAGLSPLEDTPFNACKSDIKFLDYSALGLASIVSDGRPYREDPNVRKLALVTKNTPKAWTAALAAIDADRARYRALAESAREYIWAERSVDTIGARCVRLIERLMGD